MQDGELGALESLLAHDVVLTGDGGGKVPALARSIRGRARVARTLTNWVKVGARIPGAHTVRLDIADTAGLPGVLDDIRTRFGPISMLVNNAAAFHRYRFLDSADAGTKITEPGRTSVVPESVTSVAAPACTT